MKIIDVLNDIMGGIKKEFYSRFVDQLNQNGIVVVKREITPQEGYKVDFQYDLLYCDYKGLDFELHGSHKGAQWTAKVIRNKRTVFQVNVQTIDKLPQHLDRFLRKV